MGEFLVIAVIAVLILGPDKLPKAIATLVQWTRALRDQAANARREIVAAAELDPSITDEIKQSVKDIAELHPRRLAASIMSDVDTATAPAAPAAAPAPAAGPAASGAPAAATAFDPDAT
jgi:sec-independent protein translocase protein TatB